MLPTNSSYYPPQGHPCYYPSAVQSAAQHPAYFNPYHNFGLATPQHLPQSPQPQIPPPSSAANDSGIHSQPPSPEEEGDKENVRIQLNARGKSNDPLNDDERRKYREKRDRNNHAAKISRMHRKQREQTLSAELVHAKTELVHVHEINKRLQDELAAFHDFQSRMVGSLQQIIIQLKVPGADPSDVLAQLQECSNSMMASMSQQNPALMAPPHPQGFPTFF